MILKIFPIYIKSTFKLTAEGLLEQEDIRWHICVIFSKKRYYICIRAFRTIGTRRYYWNFGNLKA